MRRHQGVMQTQPAMHMSSCKLQFLPQIKEISKVMSKGVPAGSLYRLTVQNSNKSFYLVNPSIQPSYPTLISYEIHSVSQARNEIEIFI